MSYYFSINQDSTIWIGEKCGRIMLNKKNNMKLLNLKPIPFKLNQNKIKIDIKQYSTKIPKQEFDNFVEYNLCYKIPSKNIKDDVICDVENMMNNFIEKNKHMSFNIFKSFAQEKHEVNSTYVYYVKHFGCHDRLHLVLDAETLLTAHYLHQIGVKSSNIYVPNPNTKHFMIDRYTKNVNLWNGMLHDFICVHSKISKQFSSMFLDYCCTFDGNQICCPKLDISLLLNNDMLTDKCVVGFTFCTRNSITKNVTEVIHKMFKKKYKKVELIIEKRYHTMIFLLYVINSDL